MKYRLTEDCKMLGWKKGQVFEGHPKVPHEMVVAYSSRGPTISAVDEPISKVELSLLLKTGILEEVKEEEWPREGDTYWYISTNGEVDYIKWQNNASHKEYKEFNNCFRTREEALEASEKIKTLLLSLKK